MSTIDDLLNRAVEHHQAGRLADAELLYRGVLDQVPEESNALHLLGVVRWRSGHPREGVELISRAIAIRGDFAPYYINLGNLYRALEEPLTAIDCFERGVVANPDSLPLRELFCGMVQDLAVVAIKDEDLDGAGRWCRRCFPHLVTVPGFTRIIYDLLERQIQIALLTDQRDLALACLKAKNRFDFPALPESAIDLFAVDLHGFPEWCAATGARAEIWRPAPQPVPATLYDDYPDYLHPHIQALPSLAEAPVGVALGLEVEVIQGFYVKDNYESFVIAGRRTMLCENKTNVVRSSIVPLVGVTPGATSATLRLPRAHYPVVELPEPAIFVPSTPNYWHFMVEVLPMLMACATLPETRDLPVILFDVRNYQYEMFDLVGVARERIVDMRKSLESEGAQVLYRFRQAAIPSQIPYPVAYRWLREAMLPQIAAARGDLPRRVFLSRRSSYPKHRIANDTEVGALLARYGFTVVLPETLSVLETVALIAQAEMVVAPIGAGTSNHIFLPPRSTWIHLNNPDFFHPDSPWNAQMGTQATLVGHFRHLTGRFTGDPAGFPERLVDRLEIPIEIDLPALARLVEEAEARLPHPGTAPSPPQAATDRPI